MINKNMTVNELLRNYPCLQTLLEEYHIDYCCGGHRTLQEVAEQDCFDLEQFLKDVEQKLKEENCT
ncbi:DUF542 domain-containing protein [Hydrogenobacter hydrogenophilus]|uniref:Regulator of cell morphogenesis and NO signaling n=1 Tax=Hydrogenobacter hydrogenophilus TaxID=35835 RepID=A0A285P4P8_9AQUI|nr:DUF542 domain-containing protein [Hydrogenobacter hydrogenophilus]SNZ16438.1 regulator of cell morphogenesis and NO signaling [Hydrogenobacter hydrogenophilus]